MHGRAVGRSLVHSRHTLHAFEEAFAERAGLVVQIPIIGFGDDQALGEIEPKAVDIRNEHDDAGKVLPACDDTEFGACLIGVDGVRAAIGKTDDLGLGGLRLQQERREIRRVQRSPRAAEHLAAAARTTSRYRRSIEWPKI